MGRYPGAEGMKTGFVCPSGFNVVASATRGGRRRKGAAKNLAHRGDFRRRADRREGRGGVRQIAVEHGSAGEGDLREDRRSFADTR